MSDIQVDSELLLDRAAFLAELRASQQDVEAFVTACNNLQINIPVRMRDELTTAVQRLVADLNASGLQINIPVVMGGVGGGAGGGGIADSFNTTNFQQQVNLMQQNLQQQLHLMQTQIDNSIDNSVNNTSNVVNNITNSGGRSGKGSGGRGSLGGLPIGRGISAMMLLRQTMQFVKEEQAVEQRSLNTEGDPTRMLEADIENRKAHDSMFFGIGELGRNIGERVFSGAGTTDDLENELRHKRADDAQAKDARSNRDFATGIRNRYQEETTPQSQERARVQAEDARIAAQQKITDHRTEEQKKIDDRYRQSLTEADVERKKISWGLRGDTHTNQADEMRRNAEALHEAESRKLNDATALEQSQQAAASAATKDRQEKEFAMQDKQAGSRADAAEMRSRGDFSGADRLERQARREEGQLSADNTSKAAGEAYRRESAAQEKVDDAEESYRRGSADFSSDQRVTNTRAGAYESQLRMQGRTRDASDAAYSRQLQDQIDAKEQEAKNPDKEISARAAAEAKALRDAMPTRMQEHELNEYRQENYSAARSQASINDMGVNVRAANLRAGGSNVEAGNVEYENALNNKVKALKDAADAESDVTKKTQLLAEATAQQTANVQLVAARKAEQARQISEEVSDNLSHAGSSMLRAEGRNYEADKATRNQKYALGFLFFCSAHVIPLMKRKPTGVVLPKVGTRSA